MEKVEIGLETDAEFKAECDELFAKLGVSTEEAISVFLHQAVMEQGFPFRIELKGEPLVCLEPTNPETGKVIHIFGKPNSGKTVLRNALAERHPDFNSYSINDFRKWYGDGTYDGEIDAQFNFYAIELGSKGFYERSGRGRFCQYMMNSLYDQNVYIIVLDVPDDICISRIDPHKYDDIPHSAHWAKPEEYIELVSRFLCSKQFKGMCRGYKVLRLDGMIPLDQQVAQVERFTGIQDPAGQRYGIQLPTFRN